MGDKGTGKHTEKLEKKNTRTHTNLLLLVASLV